MQLLFTLYTFTLLNTVHEYTMESLYKIALVVVIRTTLAYFLGLELEELEKKIKGHGKHQNSKHTSDPRQPIASQLHEDHNERESDTLSSFEKIFLGGLFVSSGIALVRRTFFGAKGGQATANQSVKAVGKNGQQGHAAGHLGSDRPNHFKLF